MALYRLHKGDLQKSLDTTVIVKSKEELINHINESPHIKHKINEVKIEKYGESFDKRIGWYTHLVSIKYPDGKWYPDGYLSEDI